MAANRAVESSTWTDILAMSGMVLGDVMWIWTVLAHGLHASPFDALRLSEWSRTYFVVVGALGGVVFALFPLLVPVASPSRAIFRCSGAYVLLWVLPCKLPRTFTVHFTLFVLEVAVTLIAFRALRSRWTASGGR